MKKTLALLLVLALCLAAAPSMAESASQYRLVNDGEEIELRISLIATTSNDDYVNNTFTDWITEQTGVSLRIDTLPSTDSKDKLNLMLAGGDYPDIIFGNNLLTMAEQQIYGAQGILLPINQYVYEYCPNFLDALELFPAVDVMESFLCLDGNVYSFPNLVECYHCAVAARMWVYEPWLDKLGLELPETTEEFYQMLKAFKEQDPNGNGEADEIPLTGSTNGWNGSPRDFIMNAFVQTGNVDDLYLKDGKVTLPYDKPEWKQGLEYMHMLYSEGLIAPEMFTQNSDQLTLQIEADTPTIGCAPGGTPPGKLDEGGVWMQYTAAPALEGPEGFRSVAYTPTIGNESRVYVTNGLSDSERKLEVGFEFINVLFDQYVWLRANFGVEGVDWRFAEEGEIGYTGEHPGVIKFLGNSETPNEMNQCWYQQISEIQNLDFRFGRIMDSPLEMVLYQASNDCMYPYLPADDTIVPRLVYPSDDAAEVSDLNTALTQYVDESFARFVTGDASLESDWDSYLNELKMIGIDRYLELQQKAYDLKKAL